MVGGFPYPRRESRRQSIWRPRCLQELALESVEVPFGLSRCRSGERQVSSQSGKVPHVAFFDDVGFWKCPHWF